MYTIQVTTGKLPWTGATVPDVKRAFKTNALQLPPYLSSEAAEFISLLLNPHPTMRLGSLGADEVCVHAIQQVQSGVFGRCMIGSAMAVRCKHVHASKHV